LFLRDQLAIQRHRAICSHLDGQTLSLGGLTASRLRQLHIETAGGIFEHCRNHEKNQQEKDNVRH
jgi:hypothetical protein